MKNVYLVVEGVHDAAFIGRLLTKHAKLAQIKEQTKLPPGWQTFVDNFGWPTRNRQGVLDISRLAVPAPLFFGHPQHDLMVAVSNAEGIANLAARLESDLEQILLGKLVLDGVGVVLDSDEEDAQARLSKLLAELRARDVQIPIPDKPELEWSSTASRVLACLRCRHQREKGRWKTCSSTAHKRSIRSF